jgi:imidazolonepropionase-like amidohydrolase
LAAAGGFFENAEEYQAGVGRLARNLAAYLYSGVSAVRSAGDPVDMIFQLRAKMQAAEWVGSELFLVGPSFTAEGGHPTEMMRNLPEPARPTALQQLVRTPVSAEQARSQVKELKRSRVDAIKVVLDAGQPGLLFNRMDIAILRAIIEQARAEGLSVICHTGRAEDVHDAVAAGVAGIEHGSTRDAIPQETFALMKARTVSYDPTLVVYEALAALGEGRTDLLDRSLVQQVALPQLMLGTRKLLVSPQAAGMRAGLRRFSEANSYGKQNLAAAWKAGVTLVAGTDSGNPLVVHGPGLHRELQLWVAAGVSPRAALEAATVNAARAIGAGERIGRIRKGYEATLLLVDGNPLQDVSDTERISLVVFKGERIYRPDLFDQPPEK